LRKIVAIFFIQNPHSSFCRAQAALYAFLTSCK
jgi:hypothetical protein